MNDKVPNPGSEEAIEQGCKCPVVDNHFGAGIHYSDDGEPQFWIRKDCPLHGREINETK